MDPSCVYWARLRPGLGHYILHQHELGRVICKLESAFRQYFGAPELHGHRSEALLTFDCFLDLSGKKMLRTQRSDNLLQYRGQLASSNTRKVSIRARAMSIDPERRNKNASVVFTKALQLHTVSNECHLYGFFLLPIRYCIEWMPIYDPLSEYPSIR